MPRQGKDKRGYVYGARAALLLAEPELVIERARFIGSFAYKPPEGKLSTDGKRTEYTEPERRLEDRALLQLLVLAQELRSASTIDDWREYASAYPKTELTKREQKRRKNNPHRSVRAHFAFEGVLRLLEIVKAPPELRAEFQLFASQRRPRAADKRARAQEQILKNPQLSIRQIAELSGYSASEISRDLDAGYLLWPR